MTWFFVRHGQSTYNLQNKFTGWHDPSLSELGEKQATETAIKLSKYNIDIIYSSNLSRAKETAEIIIKNHPNTPKNIISNELLNERNYGDWSGKNKEEVKNEIGDDNFLKVRRGWDTPPENGESLKDTADRVKQWVDDLKKLHNNNENILIVSHGNTIRAISVILDINTEENVHEFELQTGEIFIV